MPSKEDLHKWARLGGLAYSTPGTARDTVAEIQRCSRNFKNMRVLQNLAYIACGLSLANGYGSLFAEKIFAGPTGAHIISLNKLDATEIICWSAEPPWPGEDFYAELIANVAREYEEISDRELGDIVRGTDPWIQARQKHNLYNAESAFEIGRCIIRRGKMSEYYRRMMRRTE